MKTNAVPLVLLVILLGCKKKEEAYKIPNGAPLIERPEQKPPNKLNGTLYHNNLDFGAIPNRPIQITTYQNDERVLIKELKTDETGKFYFNYEENLIGSRINIEVGLYPRFEEFEEVITNYYVLDRATDSFYINRLGVLEVFLSESMTLEYGESVYLYTDKPQEFNIRNNRGESIHEFIVPLNNDYIDRCKHVGFTYSFSKNKEDIEKQRNVEHCVYALPRKNQVYI